MLGRGCARSLGPRILCVTSRLLAPRHALYSREASEGFLCLILALTT